MPRGHGSKEDGEQRREVAGASPANKSSKKIPASRVSWNRVRYLHWDRPTKHAQRISGSDKLERLLSGCTQRRRARIPGADSSYFPLGCATAQSRREREHLRIPFLRRAELGAARGTGAPALLGRRRPRLRSACAEGPLPAAGFPAGGGRGMERASAEGRCTPLAFWAAGLSGRDGRGATARAGGPLHVGDALGRRRPRRTARAGPGAAR